MFTGKEKLNLYFIPLGLGFSLDILFDGAYILYAFCMPVMEKVTKDLNMERIEQGQSIEILPPPPTIIVCPVCRISWSADYDDYCWMRDRDVLVCACGEVLCEVSELSD